MFGFSFSRTRAVFGKEFIQLRRDRLTFGMIIGIPLMQLLLFGYAINSDPRHLPAVVQTRDPGEVSRAITAAIETSTFLDFIGEVQSPTEADRLLRTGEANFVVVVPEDFEAKLIRGERPQILIEADATDPVASGGPIGAMPQIVESGLAHVLKGPLSQLQPRQTPWEIVIHRRYNPANITAYNVVPGLLGTILTMTMAMMTAMAITREVERGTMEALLSTPVKPIEVMIGKILPYVGIGFLQTAMLLGASKLLFHIPFVGSFLPLSAGVSLFILVNLALGFLISTVARTQMQAMQLAFFVFLPSILLSGFVFPFAGMPEVAQWIGSALPTTHFIRLVREVILKGGSMEEVIPNIWPMAIQLGVITLIAMNRYRRTLD